MKKKLLYTALASVAAVTLSSAAFADIFNTNSNSGLYLGVQAGYGNTHWNDIDGVTTTLPWLLDTLHVDAKGTGFAGRAFAGYALNQYLAIEGGYTYFPKTDIKLKTSNNTTIAKTDFNTYGLDLVGKITVPVIDKFNLFAKAGPGYLHSGDITVDGTKIINSTSNVDLVYGFGAGYQITPSLVADVSFTRFNGHHKVTDDKYQPNADLYAVGLSYKINV